MENIDIKAKVKEINGILEKGEPNNISEDAYSGYTGYKPQYVIDAMNAILFGDWGFIEISNEVKETSSLNNKTGEKKNYTIAIAQVQVWLKGVEFKPVAYGQSIVTSGALGDAMKGAQTDAIKKALSYFSIGNRAYHGLLERK